MADFLRIRFGPGPHKVKIELEFNPEEVPDGTETSFTIELAPIDLVSKASQSDFSTIIICRCTSRLTPSSSIMFRCHTRLITFSSKCHSDFGTDAAFTETHTMSSKVDQLLIISTLGLILTKVLRKQIWVVSCSRSIIRISPIRNILWDMPGVRAGQTFMSPP